VPPALKTRSDAIEPFWQRLRAISQYPLRGSALMTIAVLAGLRLLALPLLPLAWLIDMLISIALFKYAAEVLNATANGRLDPPEPSVGVEESLGWQLIMLQILMYAAVVVVHFYVGSGAGLLTLVLVTFAIPGACMSLAIDQNFLHALNPLTWVSVMVRFGWPYFVVALLCLIYSISAGNIEAMILPHLPIFVSLLLSWFLTHYVVVATFHLMGYLIWQYHEKIGFEPEPQGLPPNLRRADADPDQPLIDGAQALLQRGEPRQAAEMMAAQIRPRGATLPAHEFYRKILTTLGDTGGLLEHGRQFVPVLLALDQDNRALEVMEQCLRRDHEFHLAEGDDFHRLAEQAAKLGRDRLALVLLSTFGKHYRKHRDLPKNHLLAARLLAERMQQPAQALALLVRLQERYPGHELRPDIDALAQRLAEAAVSADRTPAPQT
jgi:hypothetical protein